jgi:hypothetical protein
MRVGSAGDLDNFTLGTDAAGGALLFRKSVSTTDRYLALGAVDNNFAFTERVRIADSGNVGIGTSSPSGYASDYRQVIVDGGANPSMLQLNNTTTGSGSNTGGLAIVQNGVDAFLINPQATGTTRFFTNNTERMRIDSSGNVGIGTSSPRKRLEVTSTAGANAIQSQDSDNSTNFLRMYSDVSSGSAINVNTGGVIRFAHSDEDFSSFSERARIDASGNLLVGTTSADGKLTSLSSIGGTPAIYCQNSTASGNVGLLTFGSGSPIAYRGEIFYDNSAAVLKFTGQASGTYSDARLKTIIGDCKYGLSAINQLSTKTFTWVRNGKEDIGLVAQELYSVVPEAVEVGTDGELDATGDFDPRDVWKVDFSKLVPVLVKAVQEQQAIIEALEARVAALEA